MTSPVDSERVMIASVELILICRACAAVPPALSVTLMMKLYIPAVLDMPEIAPVAELSDRPGGRYPVDVDQV